MPQNAACQHLAGSSAEPSVLLDSSLETALLDFSASHTQLHANTLHMALSQTETADFGPGAYAWQAGKSDRTTSCLILATLCENMSSTKPEHTTQRIVIRGGLSQSHR